MATPRRTPRKAAVSMPDDATFIKAMEYSAKKMGWKMPTANGEPESPASPVPAVASAAAAAPPPVAPPTVNRLPHVTPRSLRTKPQPFQLSVSKRKPAPTETAALTSPPAVGASAAKKRVRSAIKPGGTTNVSLAIANAAQAAAAAHAAAELAAEKEATAASGGEAATNEPVRKKTKRASKSPKPATPNASAPTAATSGGGAGGADDFALFSAPLNFDAAASSPPPPPPPPVVSTLKATRRSPRVATEAATTAVTAIGLSTPAPNRSVAVVPTPQNIITKLTTATATVVIESTPSGATRILRHRAAPTTAPPATPAPAPAPAPVIGSAVRYASSAAALAAAAAEDETSGAAKRETARRIPLSARKTGDANAPVSATKKKASAIPVRGTRKRPADY